MLTKATKAEGTKNEPGHLLASSKREDVLKYTGCDVQASLRHRGKPQVSTGERTPDL